MKAFIILGFAALSACVGSAPRPDPRESTPAFYTVTAEIALARHDVRTASLQYAAAATTGDDPELLRRAADVTAACLQPTLTAGVAARWMQVEPANPDAHRAAANAALDLHQIERAAAQYRVVLDAAAGDAQVAATVAADLSSAANVYGARQVADRLAQIYPASAEVRRMQAFAALRADDPAAAVPAFEAALAATSSAGRRDLSQGLWRARILAGDAAPALADAARELGQDESPGNRLDFALLLVAAQEDQRARAEFATLLQNPEAAPVALRLLALLDFQDDKLDAAGAGFAQLLATGKFADDALYHLGLIAERHGDWQRALKLYAEVHAGDDALAALLRAAALLRQHGAAPAADELFRQLVEELPARAPDILAAQARAYADAGESARADAILAQARQEYPDSVDLDYARASLAEDQGHVAAALRELKAVAARRPTDPAALNAYGYTLADHGRDLGRARTLIERAHVTAPKSAAILDSLGWVLYRQGHGAEALPYLSEAYADDHDGDVAAHLGEVLWQLGRRDEAQQIWSAASREGAENRLVTATRQRLHASN